LKALKRRGTKEGRLRHKIEGQRSFLSPAEHADFAKNQATELHGESEMHRERKKRVTDKENCNKASTAKVLPMGEDLGGAKILATEALRNTEFFHLRLQRVLREIYFSV
jgi:hypothetical protein